MVVFSGPHAYVSPSWYEEGGTVPTWNYLAVHAYGTFQVAEDRDDVLAILRRSVLAHESPRPEPWPFATSRSRMSRGCSGRSSASASRSPGWRASGSCPRTTRRRGEDG
jgi:transcriptional regulator